MHLMNLYSFSIILFCIGLYITIASEDNVKKLFGLSLFQNSVLWFFIALGKVSSGIPPILSTATGPLYSNPLPDVLMLTAIVVGVATIAVGFILAIRIGKAEMTI
jgi:multicomponent Na+:H+ antiporter subunit C